MKLELTVDDWLLVQRPSSQDVHGASLRTALLNAHDFSHLVVELPTMLPALLRQVLLPVVLDALGRPKDEAAWLKTFRAGRFTEEQCDRFEEYLDKYRDRFELFSAETPFAQVAGLRTEKDETKNAALLVATAASGNNVPLFANRTDADPLSLTPAEAARWLLHAHCWDTAAIKSGAAGDKKASAGKTTGNHTGPLGGLGVIVPVGRTLFETLLLNLPIGVQPEEDRPQWLREPASPSWEIRGVNGLLDLWTWQSRRIRLVPEETDEGVRVRQVVLCAGDRMTELPDYEPHTAWRYQKVPKSSALARRPRRHAAGKAAWRGMEALLAPERNEPDEKRDGSFESSVLLHQLGGVQARDGVPNDYPLQIQTVGMVYGTQSAVLEDVVADEIPLPVTALRPDEELFASVVEITEQAEELARAANGLSADLRRAAGTDPLPWDKGQRPGELVLHLLDPLVRRFLAGARSTDPELLERGQLAWERHAYQRVWEVADKELANTVPSVFRGREVEVNNRTYVLRQATAEQSFRARIRKILPRLYDQPKGPPDAMGSPRT